MMRNMVKTADEVDAHIGARVKLRRMAVGMSQEQLGEALGLTFQQVQKYEKGLNRIGAGRLYRIARILGVSACFFFEGLPEGETDEAKAAASERTAEILAFVGSAEGYHLSNAFAQIADAPTRRRLVELIRTIAGAEARAVAD